MSNENQASDAYQRHLLVSDCIRPKAKLKLSYEQLSCITFRPCTANILKKTSNAKYELVLLEWTTHSCLRLVLYEYETCEHFFITAMIYGIMNYSLLVPN